MSTLALFWSKNNPGEGRAPGATDSRPWGIPWALLARASGPTRVCRPTWAGERGPVSKFIPYLTSPDIPTAPSAPNLATSSHSSHGGHAQWCWGMRGDQAEQGAAPGLDTGPGARRDSDSPALGLLRSPFLISQASTALPQHPHTHAHSLSAAQDAHPYPLPRRARAGRRGLQGSGLVHQGCPGHSVPGREGKLRQPGWARNATASSEHPSAPLWPFPTSPQAQVRAGLQQRAVSWYSPTHWSPSPHCLTQMEKALQLPGVWGILMLNSHLWLPSA